MAEIDIYLKIVVRPENKIRLLVGLFAN